MGKCGPVTELPKEHARCEESSRQKNDPETRALGGLFGFSRFLLFNKPVPALARKGTRASRAQWGGDPDRAAAYPRQLGVSTPSKLALINLVSAVVEPMGFSPK